MTYIWYDNLKNRLSKVTLVDEIPSHPHFSHPNNFSDYNLNIRYGKWSNKINRLSPFSRFGHGIVDKDANLIVFCSPKVGSTTIRNFAITQLSLNDTYPIHEYVHGTPLPLVTSTLFENTARNISNKTIYWNDYKKYEKIIVMRNPWERMVSFFIDKYINRFKLLQDNIDSVYLGRNCSYLPVTTLNILDLTFNTWIECQFNQFNNHEKICDEHLGLQVTSDFKEVALNESRVLNMNEIPELLKYWSDKRGVDANVNQKENANYIGASEFVEHAYNIKLKDLIRSKKVVHPSSFLNDVALEQMRKIYQQDYEVWNQTRY